jgi:serine/threonine protein kinase
LASRADLPRPFVEFVYSLLRYNPKERLTASQALQHSWLAAGDLGEEAAAVRAVSEIIAPSREHWSMTTSELRRQVLQAQAAYAHTYQVAFEHAFAAFQSERFAQTLDFYNHEGKRTSQGHFHDTARKRLRHYMARVRVGGEEGLETGR